MDFSVLPQFFGQFSVICLVCVISGSCIFNTADSCILSSEVLWFSGKLNVSLLQRESRHSPPRSKNMLFVLVEMVKLLLRLILL